METHCDDIQQENIRLARELAAAQEALQSFVYIVSHDLGAPLRALTGFSEILQKKYSLLLDDKGKTYLRLLYDGGAKAQAMMQGLLQYSRVYTQGAAPMVAPLAEVLQRALIPFQDKVERKELRLSVGNLPRLLCDHVQIVQLFQILLDNALLYKRPSLPAHVNVEAFDKGDVWAVEVTDNGIGISPKDATRIFQIFKRLHADDVYPGLGVGLAIAARIVQRHRGTLTVRPDASGGSVFVFTLHKDGPFPTSLDSEGNAHV